ncbi:MAG: hypothetical protein IJU98_06635 [Synergistaceae bacterium]|nr:hypothetical protein [Synergistaceae bacterium]
MKKAIALLVGLLAVAVAAGASWGATNDDPFNHYDLYTSPIVDTSPYYNGDLGFYYQLRDVSGEKRDGHTIAGAQWFATTYENYLRLQYNWYHNITETDPARYLYRRTLGGEMSEVPMTTLADLLNYFDYVYVDEPEPYRNWLLNYGGYLPTQRLYDEYVNPMETIYMVIPEGRGEMKINFANHYARHFPYWWWSATTGTGNNGDETNTDVNPPTVTISGDVVSLISHDIMEDIRMSAGEYTITVTPSRAQRVAPGEYLEATLRLQAPDPEAYGSTTGTIAFRQSAALSDDSIGWRESSLIPVVVANVHDGPASDPGNELLFDMTIRDTSVSNYATNDLAVVNRVKFRWGAGEDMTQDIGKFYMMKYYNLNMPSFDMEVRVTNRTGTRYRMQRYDQIASADNNPTARAGFVNIKPAYWAYDLTTDNLRYGDFPTSFILDEHSQIAPGLVTIYNNNLGYTTINTAYGTSESFRVYPFSGSTWHNLTLQYDRIGGMVDGNWNDVVWSSARAAVRPFTFSYDGTNTGFVDRRENSDHTAQELKDLMQAVPQLVSVTDLPNIRSELTATTYTGRNALNSFTVNAAVPSDLVDLPLRYSDDGTTETKAPLLPVVVRLKIPRQEQLLTTGDRWAKLDAAESGKALFNEFAKFGTIWVRSDATRQLDTNLITALNRRASSHGFDVSDTIRAFIYNDVLYLEFIAILADAVSPNEGKTAFIELIKDDGIPYLLIGDGAADGAWNIGFFVEDTGANPEDDPEETKSDSGSGGGCDAGMFSGAALCLGILTFLLRRGRD